MKWEVINNERSSLLEYRLTENEECKLTIKYNPRHQSARITSGNHHRSFYFQSAGSLSGKTILKNEYGMEIGYLVHDKFDRKEGSLVIDERKYQYSLHQGSVTKVTIYESGHAGEASTFTIPAGRNALREIFFTGAQALSDTCCLLGTCWYALLATAKPYAITPGLQL